MNILNPWCEQMTIAAAQSVHGPNSTDQKCTMESFIWKNLSALLHWRLLSLRSAAVSDHRSGDNRFFFLVHIFRFDTLFCFCFHISSAFFFFFIFYVSFCEFVLHASNDDGVSFSLLPPLKIGICIKKNVTAGFFFGFIYVLHLIRFCLKWKHQNADYMYVEVIRNSRNIISYNHTSFRQLSFFLFFFYFFFGWCGSVGLCIDK